jgi:hypothetical protein
MNPVRAGANISSLNMLLDKPAVLIADPLDGHLPRR